MFISKFLLIESALTISAFVLIFWLKGSSKSSSLGLISNKEELSKKPYINLPNKAKLLDLEKLAILKGSGIAFDSLVGNWKFVSVWKKDTDDEDYIFSSLLRVFSANLELTKDISLQNPLGFSITTSIQFGFLSIKFSGSGYLKGKQPFLPYFFNLIELKTGSSVLFSKSIKTQVEKDKSSFALIACDESKRWLAARGQGGGLALWLKD